MRPGGQALANSSKIIKYNIQCERDNKALALIVAELLFALRRTAMCSYNMLLLFYEQAKTVITATLIVANR